MLVTATPFGKTNPVLSHLFVLKRFERWERFGHFMLLKAHCKPQHGSLNEWLVPLTQIKYQNKC